MKQFYCSKPGGIRRGDLGEGIGKNERAELVIMEGTREKGPWYDAAQFSDAQIGKCVKNGWISFMVKAVE